MWTAGRCSSCAGAGIQCRTEGLDNNNDNNDKEKHMQTALNIVYGDWKTYQHEAERVRAMVFIAEQKVPRELEFDEDDKTAEHFITFDARHMVLGCARLLKSGRIGRVAVLRPFRGRGIGEALMKAVLERAKARGMTDVHLAAQVQAMPFYERLGFEPFGDEFDEAGIAHRMMRRVL